MTTRRPAPSASPTGLDPDRPGSARGGGARPRRRSRRPGRRTRPRSSVSSAIAGPSRSQDPALVLEGVPERLQAAGSSPRPSARPRSRSTWTRQGPGRATGSITAREPVERRRGRPGPGGPLASVLAGPRSRAVPERSRGRGRPGSRGSPRRPRTGRRRGRRRRRASGPGRSGGAGPGSTTSQPSAGSRIASRRAETPGTVASRRPRPVGDRQAPGPRASRIRSASSSSRGTRIRISSGGDARLEPVAGPRGRPAGPPPRPAGPPRIFRPSAPSRAGAGRGRRTGTARAR